MPLSAVYWMSGFSSSNHGLRYALWLTTLWCHDLAMSGIFRTLAYVMPSPELAQAAAVRVVAADGEMDVCLSVCSSVWRRLGRVRSARNHAANCCFVRRASPRPSRNAGRGHW